MSGPKFIDIHSHILYNVDDGSKSEKMSLKMLEQAVNANIVQLVATPHANDLTQKKQGDLFIKRFEHLQLLIEKHRLPIKLLLGSELFFGAGIETLLQARWATFGNNRKYLLFELPLYEMPKDVEHFIFERHLEGITPILAHPERYSYLHKRLDKLVDWHHQGCLMQINAGSIMGQFGERVSSVARRLIKSGLAQFVASDAHDPEYRNYEVLGQAADRMLEYLPQDSIEWLVYKNPLKVIQGASIEPFEIDESQLEDDWKSVAGLWNQVKKRLLR